MIRSLSVKAATKWSVLKNKVFTSSHQRYSMKFHKIRRKNLCWSLLNKVQGLIPATVLKKRLQLRCFPVNFAKLLRTSFL